MHAFFIGLQFLTRISLVKQTVWTEEDFGKSVRYFPLVGAVLGLIYAGIAHLMYNILPTHGYFMPPNLGAAIMLALPILLTGGIHCDGFMDTMDGIFSGRSREKMLDIMKDSRTGSFGVATFVLLVITQYSVIQDINAHQLYKVFFIMPIIGRLMMTAVITLCPYARPEGLGKAFANYASKKMLLLVVLYTLPLLYYSGPLGLFSLIMAILFTVYFSRYVTKLLGGLTGDVYGAVCVLAETVVLTAYLLGNVFIMNRGWM